MLNLIKKIVSKRGELHFCRWKILETRWFNIYLHFIAKSDQDKHEHNHPWSFVSFILCGGYREFSTEVVERGQFLTYGDFRRFSLHKTNKEVFHKIELHEPTLSLVITGPKKDEPWGYLVKNEFIDNITYRALKNSGKL